MGAGGVDSPRAQRRRRRSRPVARAAVAACAALLLLAAGPVVETVDGQTAAIVLPLQAPVASVILVPGGSSMQMIAPDGSTDIPNNFVMRIRHLLTAAGVALAYVENPFDLRGAIARMRGIKRPVFLLATSTGTVVALNDAAKLGADGPDGLILTSTVTTLAPPIGMSVNDVDLARIAVPVLFVHNANDACSSSPPAAIKPLAARLTAAGDVQTIIVSSTASGPGTSNTGAAGNYATIQCSPASPHGYRGIDDLAAEKITGWIRAHAR